MDKMSKKEITERIKLLRNKHGFTQEEMAEQVGLEYGSYVQMENGANLPSLNVLMKLSAVFNVSIDLIVSGNSIQKSDISDMDIVINFFKLYDLEKLENTKKVIEELINIAKILKI